MLEPLGLGVGNAISSCQTWRAYQRDEVWAKRGYNMNLQGMHIGVLNTIREELRDQVALMIASLDNLMVVSTLMLAIGFGFVVEGTFPPAERDAHGNVNHRYDKLQLIMLRVYAVLCTTSLCFPFWSLIFTMYIRQEAEDDLHKVMRELQRHLLRALGDASREVFDRDVVKDLHTPRPARDQERRSASAPVGKSYTQRKIELFEQVGPKHFIKRYAEHKYMPRAKMCLWIGILSNLLLCAVLLGLYLQEEYGHLPWMWRLYSGSIFGGTVASCAFLWWVKHSMGLALISRTEEEEREPRKRRHRKRSRPRYVAPTAPGPLQDALRAQPRPSRAFSGDDSPQRLRRDHSYASSNDASPQHRDLDYDSGYETARSATASSGSPDAPSNRGGALSD